ncbi:MAG: hypothetical protein WA252_10540 [Candidatus Sulfotelmatobacter sp.]
MKFSFAVADELLHLRPPEPTCEIAVACGLWDSEEIWEIPAATIELSQHGLKATTDELQTLEKPVLSGDCAPRVLVEFRSAVDSIRQTAWAVQQWGELQQQNRDPYALLGTLSAERVRRTTKIAKDLTVDLESLELGLETEGLEALYVAIKGLYERFAAVIPQNLGLACRNRAVDMRAPRYMSFLSHPAQVV